LQVMFGGAMDEMKKLALGIAGAGFAAQTLRTVYPSDDLSLIDVVAPGVDKSEALEFLCDRFQIGINESLAIGDNWNDRSMLLAAGLGCVMANADPDLRSLGLHEVPGNDEDGVACAIERFILGSE
jgi:hydroxymethylpyrimidine pyrophosphatase-like HAD family hydrolase